MSLEELRAATAEGQHALTKYIEECRENLPKAGQEALFAEIYNMTLTKAKKKGTSEVKLTFKRKTEDLNILEDLVTRLRAWLAYSRQHSPFHGTLYEQLSTRLDTMANSRLREVVDKVAHRFHRMGARTERRTNVSSEVFAVITIAWSM